MISRKVVYVHKLREDFTVEGKDFKAGKILYIGSGHSKRVIAKANRSDVHLSLWDKLDKEIVANDLSIEEAYDLEQKLILEHWDSFLLNQKKIIDKVKTYKFEELDKIFYIDENSVLRWKEDRRSYNGGIRVKAGTPAGYSYNNGYMLVSINRTNYMVHRIIWCLHNKQDAPAGMVVDHIDRNPANNHYENLRLVSHRDNLRNKNTKTNTGEHNITFYEDSCYFLIQVSQTPHCVTRKRVYGIKTLVANGMSYEEAYKIKIMEAMKIRDELVAGI